jgi:hypothetical protein
MAGVQRRPGRVTPPPHVPPLLRPVARLTREEA